MAWSSAALAVADVAYYDDDLPCFVAKGANDDASAWAIEWNNSGTYGTDQTASYFPTDRLYDWRQNAATNSGTNATTQYLIIETGGTFDFDCCLIGVNSFGDVNATQVDLQIADDAAFSTNLQTIETWTTGLDNGRLGSFSLKHTGSDPLVYSDVPYIRLVIAGDSATPYITEWILGTRLQMSHVPNRPYYAGSYTHATSPLVSSRSGISKRITWGHTLRRYSLAFTPDDETQQARFNSLHAQSQWGTRPFVWCPSPSSDASNWSMLMIDEPEHVFPYVGPNARQAVLNVTEQPPGRALGP